MDPISCQATDKALTIRPTTASRLRHPGVIAWLLVIGLWISVEPALGGEPRRDELVEVVEQVKAAVVNIHSERTVAQNPQDPFRSVGVQPQRVNGMGTGIVLDPRGYIVTNHHVVDDVQSLRVRLVDGTTCPAKVLATDKESDLAIIKIDPPRPLPVLKLGTADDLMLAERVIAIGNAYGYEHTVTIGHVSAMKRDVSLNKEISYKSLIQTQTPINPGNSGGPLLNKLGEVVGINVAIRAGAQNIAFAIPVDSMIERSAAMLNSHQRGGVRHGLVLKNRVERLGENEPVARTVTVVRVEPYSVAAKSGFQPGDAILQVGDLPIATSIDLERALIDRPSRFPVPVRVRRGEDTVDLKLAFESSGNSGSSGSPAPASPSDVVSQKLGIRVTAVGAEAVAQADRNLRGGLMIVDVVNGSPAAKAGLEKGDILIGLHLWESINLDNVLFVITHKDLASFSPVKAYFLRDGRIRDTALVNLE